MIRIISCLDIKNNLVVKGVKFKDLKIINDPYLLCKKYELCKTDEIIILDITSNYTKKSLSYKNIKLISKNVNIPISIGGGIRNFNKVSKLFKIGADRIILNTFCYENIIFLKKISDLYGSQSVIVSIDINLENKIYKTYKNSGFICTKFELLDWIIIVKKIGCGEILITSIKNDGLRKGYDIKSIIYVKKNIDISIIISGGLGSINDIYYFYKYCKINSFLIASVFHFNYLIPNYIKKYICLI